MRFEIGDKVMLVDIPYGNFNDTNKELSYYEEYGRKVQKVKGVIGDKLYFRNGYFVHAKYFEHATKLKPVKYRVCCGNNMTCGNCPRDINGKVEICKFVGTKNQVEKHIKKYWPQPGIKEVK